MPYALLDDQLPDHPKILAAGPLAGWLYVCGIAYCARLLTDGFIPEAMAPKLAALPADEITPLVTRLLTVGLWEQTEGGYRVHDYLRHNPSRAKVLEQRKQTRERQDRWKRAHLEDSIKEGANAVSNASPVAPQRRVSDASDNGVTNASYLPPIRDSSAPSGAVPDAPSAPAERPKAAPRTQPAPKPQGVSLAPLADAFAARGLDFPSPKSGREVQAVQALLRRAAPAQIAACWAAICEGEYGSDFDQKRLSFCHLEGQRFIDNWLAASSGRMRPPQRQASNGRAPEPIRSVAQLAAKRLKLMQENGYDDEHFINGSNGTGGRSGVAAELSGVPGRHGPAHQQLPAPRGG